MVKRRGAHWAITHFNLFTVDVPLTGHVHTAQEHKVRQQQGHHVTLDGSDLKEKW